MDLTHHFHVPTGIGDTWTHFQDVAGLAGCFPGAQVTSVEGDNFTGTCKVKLGPIALQYGGTGVFVERDEAAHRMTVEAKGKDKRGNGTAAAKARLTMSEATDGGTDVEVVTDLSVTGKPAQFGRGLIQDVSDKLLGQFVGCLQQQLSPSEPEASDDVDAGPVPGPRAAVTGAPTDAATAAAPVAAASPAVPRPAPRPPPQQPEALDLGATVLPILLKNYWKQAAAGVLAVAVLITVIRRR